jgi:hypothetical protein
MAKRRNIYTHGIDLKKLLVKNAPSKEFASAIEKIPYRGYEVEDISDGRKIVIVKPGGKQAWGRINKEDFFVFIYNPKDQTLWQISHGQIYDYLAEKSQHDQREAIELIKAFERVYNGEEPDDVLKTMNSQTSKDYDAEALLKAYKWIWGQEDVNYPTGKGRAMSWEGWGWDKVQKKLVKTGTGLKDLLDRLIKETS